FGGIEAAAEFGLHRIVDVEEDAAGAGRITAEAVAAEERGHVEIVAAEPAAVGGGGEKADIAGEGAQVAAVVGEAFEFQGDAADELGLGGGVDSCEALDDV